jgi:hypothetical protein
VDEETDYQADGIDNDVTLAPVDRLSARRGHEFRRFT